MSAVLPASLVNAANQARDRLLAVWDPVGSNPAPVMAQPPVTGQAPPLAPNGAVKKGLFDVAMRGDTFFTRVEALFKPTDNLLQADDVAATWTYSRWVNYFFAQCKGAGTVQDRGRIYTLLLDLEAQLRVSATLKFGYRQLERDPAATLPAPLSASFAALVQNQPGQLPLDLLTYLLNLGFTSNNSVQASDVKMTSYGVGGEDLNNTFGNAFGLQAAMKTTPGERDARDGWLLFYRGDSRAPAVVVQQGGATCRADLDFWRKDAQVDAEWHPWKKSLGHGGQMWLRNGDKDNDYFTVNSVGLHFHISCAYPMLKLSEVDKEMYGHVADWPPELWAKLRRSGKADIWRVNNRKTGQIEPVLVDRSRVYLCVFPGSTQLSATFREASGGYGGNSYPEAGVRNVPLNQIVAWVQIERFHGNNQLRRPPNQADRVKMMYESTAISSTMTIKVESWGWLNPKEQGKNLLGLESPSTLAQRLQAMVGRCFEINHSCLISETDTTYDPSSKKWFSLEVQGVKPLKLH